VYGNEVTLGQRVHCSNLPTPQSRREFMVLLFSDLEGNGIVAPQSEFLMTSTGKLRKFDVTPEKIGKRIATLRKNSATNSNE
jgi:hypothetical protein